MNTEVIRIKGSEYVIPWDGLLKEAYSHYGENALVVNLDYSLLGVIIIDGYGHRINNNKRFRCN